MTVSAAAVATMMSLQAPAMMWSMAAVATTGSLAVKAMT